MAKQYVHLNSEERDRIFWLLGRGQNQKQIAQILGRDKSTIGRELRRNEHQKFETYLPDTAQRKAVKKKEKGRKRRYLDKNLELKEYVLAKLKIGWSPELIEGRIKAEAGQYLNYESIYQHIYSLEGRKENLRQYLRRSHRLRRKKNGRKHQKGKIPNRLDISLRPKIVEKRRQFGHWEGDSVLFRGHRQVLATQTERKTRRVIAFRPRDKSARERTRAISDHFKLLPPQARRTMTFDNGLEFADHQNIAQTIGMKIFFAKPYSAWQRGSNENSNGLIRWYLPRKTDLNSLTDQKIEAIIEMINNRPKKCLGFKTPNEVFAEEMNKIFNPKLKVDLKSNSLTHYSVALAN